MLQKKIRLTLFCDKFAHNSLDTQMRPPPPPLHPPPSTNQPAHLLFSPFDVSFGNIWSTSAKSIDFLFFPPSKLATLPWYNLWVYAVHSVFWQWMAWLKPHVCRSTLPGVGSEGKKKSSPKCIHASFYHTHLFLNETTIYPYTQL